MQDSLTAVATIRQENGVWADFKLINSGDTPVKVCKLEDFVPHDGWEFSYYAYQVAVLQSFRVVNITLTNEHDQTIKQNAIMTLTDHLFHEKTLQKGEELKLSIPLHEFYPLEKDINYTLTVVYNRDQVTESTQSTFQVN